MLAIYEILCRDFDKRTLQDFKIAKRMLQTTKEHINNFFCVKNKNNKKLILGGKRSIQIDETVCYKEHLILYSSQMYYYLHICTLLFRLID